MVSEFTNETFENYLKKFHSDYKKVKKIEDIGSEAFLYGKFENIFLVTGKTNDKLIYIVETPENLKNKLYYSFYEFMKDEEDNCFNVGVNQDPYVPSSFMDKAHHYFEINKSSSKYLEEEFFDLMNENFLNDEEKQNIEEVKDYFDGDLVKTAFFYLPYFLYYFDLEAIFDDLVEVYGLEHVYNLYANFEKYVKRVFHLKVNQLIYHKYNGLVFLYGEVR